MFQHWISVQSRSAGVLGVLLATTATLSCPLQVVAAEFTYQGELWESGQPAGGVFDLRFEIYTSESGDVRLGTHYADDVELNDGRFAVELSYGEIFSGAERWIDVGVRPGATSNADRSDASYTRLAPRQRITPAPYAVHAFETSGLRLPISETLNLVTGPALEVRNDANTAVAGSSAGGVGVRAVTETGMGLYAQSGTGWAGYFSGPVYMTQRLALSYANATSFKLACNGDAAKPGGGSWSVLSDIRLKQNVKPLTGALDRVLQLHGRTFEYTAEAQSSGLALPGEQIGWVAQEVASVFPEWVGEDENGMKFVTERGATALLVEALRELRAERSAGVDALVAEVASQRLALEELRAECARLSTEAEQSKAGVVALERLLEGRAGAMTVEVR